MKTAVFFRPAFPPNPIRLTNIHLAIADPTGVRLTATEKETEDEGGSRKSLTSNTKIEYKTLRIFLLFPVYGGAVRDPAGINIRF